ncbi:hypothetical protein FOL47_001588 [Perkinsus chesapeaki]|uniref:Uncharacterized protein n=1 Tax=Perkinsus chesapeaki TaxID=330153 RepID=A0A7J6MID6_PERCH|nr:hypothetical protein FOL47_001588 [Perkinsus chesapeaki]
MIEPRSVLAVYFRSVEERSYSVDIPNSVKQAIIGFIGIPTLSLDCPKEELILYDSSLQPLLVNARKVYDINKGRQGWYLRQMLRTAADALDDIALELGVVGHAFCHDKLTSRLAILAGEEGSAELKIFDLRHMSLVKTWKVYFIPVEPQQDHFNIKMALVGECVYVAFVRPNAYCELRFLRLDHNLDTLKALPAWSYAFSSPHPKQGKGPYFWNRRKILELFPVRGVAGIPAAITFATTYSNVKGLTLTQRKDIWMSLQPVMVVKPTYRVAVSLKIPECSSDNDEVENTSDENKRPKSCPHAGKGTSVGVEEDTDMIKEKQLSLLRNQSNVELLTTPQRDQFDAFVAKCTGPWKDDFVNYPATEEDIAIHPDVYDFEHAGYVCRLRRTPYYAWQGFLYIDESHPLYNSKLLDLLNRNPPFDVHGGITGFSEGCVSFDCNHAMLDITPFEPFTKTDEMQKIIGTFANSMRRRVESDGEGDIEVDVDPASLIPPPFFRQTVPGLSADGSGRPRRSYKAYSFARRNLCNLAEQFRAVAKEQPLVDI